MKPVKSHLSTIVCAIAVTLCMGILYTYMYKQVDSSAAAAATAARVVKSQQVSIIDQKNTQDLFAQTADDRARLRTFFIDASNAVAFIESLEKIGEQSGTILAISGVVADDPANIKPGATGKIKGRVDATGSWNNVMRALLMAESLPYQAKLENVRISLNPSADPKIPGRNWSLSFDVTATLVSYEK
jgi:hypothetical protein